MFWDNLVILGIDVILAIDVILSEARDLCTSPQSPGHWPYFTSTFSRYCAT